MDEETQMSANDSCTITIEGVRAEDGRYVPLVPPARIRPGDVAYYRVTQIGGRTAWDWDLVPVDESAQRTE